MQERKNRKSETNCFPANAWFDKECKRARRNLRESNKTNLDIKAYKQILKNKKINFMFTRREELIFLGKNNPKLFWKELQPRKKQTENNITATQWFEYAKKLYEQEGGVGHPPLVNDTTNLFTAQERDKD